MVIHITPRPLFQILPTRHVITLTNLVYQIDLIRINTCPSPNTVNKIGIIIATLHRVNGDSIPLSHMAVSYTHLTLPTIYSV